MSARFHTTRRVEFRDTDAAGWVHFSAFFVYMEQAEHEWFRQLGLNFAQPDEDGHISWPRVAASCAYRNPAHFGDVLDVELRVQRLGRTSVTYGFCFTRDGLEIATGSVTTVCCRFRPEMPHQAIEIPELIAQKLQGPMAE